MKLFGRLAVLLVPLAVGLVSVALPGRAQTPPQSGRYAFADTTLLRDTLGLKFDELFPLADSMHTTPDTLRALAIRYHTPLRGLIHIADSLAVPIDSLGATMERERFNPLAAATGESNTFIYETDYAPAQTSTMWHNSVNWSRTTRQLVMSHKTDLQLQQLTPTEYRKDGTSTTDASWRFTPDVSAGANVALRRFYDVTPGGFANANQATNNFSAALHLRNRPTRNLTTELDLLPGRIDDAQPQGTKRGYSFSMRGRARYVRGNAFTNDLTANLSANRGRTFIPGVPTGFPTRDFTPSLSGTMGIYSNSAVGALLNYRINYSTVDKPLVAGIQNLVTQNNGADLTVRGRIDDDRNMSVIGRMSNNRSALNNPAGVNAASSFVTGSNLELEVDGRYLLFGIRLDGNFHRSGGVNRFPGAGATGGYGESTDVATVHLEANRGLGERLSLKASGDVNLTKYRDFQIGYYANAPVDRDAYDQNYLLSASYFVSSDYNTTLSLRVQRSLALNLPAKSTGSNTETHTYSAGWSWNYRLFPNLTAGQVNQINATYTLYPFQPQSSRLNMLYNNTTTLNANLSPKFFFSLSHGVQYQPGGNYTPQPDGLNALSLSDQSFTYSLGSTVTYRPAPVVGFTLTPQFSAQKRKATTAGVLLPTSDNRNFTFTGTSTLNLPIGRHGQITGNISRVNTSSNSTSYTQGVPQLLAGKPQQYVSGSLSFTWTM